MPTTRRPTIPAPTPSTAARAGRKRRPAGAVKYRCAVTGSTWSGRGLQPAWVKAALASGRTLADLAVPDQVQTDKRAKARKKVKDAAGGAGQADRDLYTRDLLEEAAA